MSTVSKHLQKLLGETDSPFWGGYVNMLKHLESAFTSPRHWVLEFLQNAEDVTATKISISLGQDSLRVLNNGTPFTDEDFYAICDVDSRKLPSLGFRGYIGIGFKSIFRVTDRVDVHSGNLHFGFDKKRWDDSKRSGVPLSRWPWEILPVEIAPEEPPTGYATCFHVPFQSMKGQQVLDEVGEFLTGREFPKEAILLLRHVENIEVMNERCYSSPFTIGKETLESTALPVGEKEIVRVWQHGPEDRDSIEDLYLLLRRNVEITDEIREDSETERTRRSEITKREVGLVFLLDSEGDLHTLFGKLAGVYSFLPIEGEQTGLPFGIFGDFIPQIGRDLINYGAKWNHWMAEKVGEYFKEVVCTVFLDHPSWKFFPAELASYIERTSVPLPGKEFWDSVLRTPIREFIFSEPVFLDEQGDRSRLDQLIQISDNVAEIFGKDAVAKAFGKGIAHGSVVDNMKWRIEQVDIYDVLLNQQQLNAIKDSKQKLSSLYRSIESLTPYQIRGRDNRDTPLHKVSFVLGEDGEFHPPEELVTVQINLNQVPSFVKTLVTLGKWFLDLEISQDEEAVRQLERCGIEVVNPQNLLNNLQNLVNSIAKKDMCPDSWRYPEDLIRATLFLMSTGRGMMERMVAEDGSLQVLKNLFVLGAPYDWSVLFINDLLPGFYPIHRMYMQNLKEFGIEQDQFYQHLEELGLHGFHSDIDKRLSEIAGYAIAKKRYEKQGHAIAYVAGQQDLGYDLECQGHCTKVFEVKGMTEPRDITLEESEVIAAEQKGSDYLLVCVYGLPADPEVVGFKEIEDPKRIWDALGKAKVPKKKWLSI